MNKQQPCGQVVLFLRRRILEDKERIEPDTMQTKTSDGKDEMNLAEFPLGALAHRLRPDQKTLHFEDRVWDERRGEMITRQLTITGSDAYGLPTALDDEVLLGLIQLTKLRGFADRKVPFTRYQLIQTLGWRNETKTYERLEASLNRWTGVTLYYANAWWNKARRCWVDEKFHVLDNVWLCHRTDRRAEVEEAEEGTTRSAFVWNEVLFRSFQAGNLKSIDFDFFKELQSAIAKRLYRFLDKRFFRRRQWEFNLKEFAYEHAGLARTYDAAGLKRKLRPGIAELEQRGYLQPKPESDRFRKLCSGEWNVVFEKATEETTSNALDSAATEALADALTERGVTPTTARATVRRFPLEVITAQLEVFDWLVARQDAKVSRNPPGFLMRAIQDGYGAPRDFVSRAVQTQREQEAAARQREADQRRHERETQAAAQESARQTAVAQYWQSLSNEGKMRAETEALARASGLQRSLLKRGGSAATACRTALLDAYAWQRLQTGE